MSLTVRLISILVVVLAAVLVTSVLEGHYVDRVFAETDRDAREAHKATRLALEAQVHFKKQVQEWKNILLRGAREKDLMKYRRQFKAETQKVRSATRALLGVLPPGSSAREAAVAFARAHWRLESQYEDGYRMFLEDRTAPFRVDASVRGIDRSPTDLLDDVVVGVDEWRDSRLDTSAARLAAARQAAYVSQAVSFVLAVLLTWWALKRWVVGPIDQAIEVADRVSKIDLRSKLTVKDPPGRLLEALRIMQDSLRTMDIERQETMQKIEQARREAKNGERAKAQFLSNISHELNTPLNGIIGNLGLLKSDLSGAQPELDEALQSSQHLYDLVKDVLAYSELDVNEAQLASRAFEPRGLIEALADKFGFHARARGLALTFGVDTDVPETMVGDSDRFRRVIECLVENALKFTDAGSVAVRVSRRASGDSGLRVDVSDTGIGIPESARYRIFEKFTQVDETNARLHGGLGLGLALCRANLRLMGGAIDFESVEGEGTTFTFEVPFKSSSAANEEAAARGPDDSDGVGTARSGDAEARRG